MVEQLERSVHNTGLSVKQVLIEVLLLVASQMLHLFLHHLLTPDLIVGSGLILISIETTSGYAGTAAQKTGLLDQHNFQSADLVYAIPRIGLSRRNHTGSAAAHHQNIGVDILSLSQRNLFHSSGEGIRPAGLLQTIPNSVLYGIAGKGSSGDTIHIIGLISQNGGRYLIAGRIGDGGGMVGHFHDPHIRNAVGVNCHADSHMFLLVAFFGSRIGSWSQSRCLYLLPPRGGDGLGRAILGCVGGKGCPRHAVDLDTLSLLDLFG